MLLVHLQSVCAQRAGTCLSQLAELKVATGELVHVTGANGLGKTTLFLGVCSVLPLKAKVLKKAVNPVLVSHKLGLNPKIDLYTNLNLHACMHGLDWLTPDQAYEVLNRLGLGSCLYRRAAELSAGQQKKALLCRLFFSAETNDPRLWLLDEPFVSLDAESLECVRLRVAELISLGHGVLISSHTSLGQLKPNKVYQLGGCDSAAVCAKGAA